MRAAEHRRDGIRADRKRLFENGQSRVEVVEMVFDGGGEIRAGDHRKTVRAVTFGQRDKSAFACRSRCYEHGNFAVGKTKRGGFYGRLNSDYGQSEPFS